MELAIRGDHAQAYRLLERLSGPLRRCLELEYSVELGGRAETDDLVNAAIERALGRWDRYRAERGALGAWLFRVGVNLARSRLRALRTRRLIEGRAARVRASASDARRERLREAVGAAIARLPRKLREVLAIDLEHGGTARAEVVARELGLATQTVLNRRCRARQLLRPILEELLR